MARTIDFTNTVRVAEGAMGTMLLQQGLEVFDNAAKLNVTAPDAVRRVHELYARAGATCATSNSFSPCHSSDMSERAEMARCAAEGVRLARQANPGLVLGDVGPSTLMIEPVGTATFDEACDVYRTHIAGLLDAGPDALIFETFIDIADLRAAMLAARDLCDLPLIASCTFNPEFRMPVSSTSPQAAAAIATALGAAVVGQNCWFGPQKALEVIERMAAATHLPLVSQPNAGLPQTDADGNTRYPGTVEQMAQAAPRFVQLGVTIMGSCCGTTPQFTRGIADALAHVQPPAPRTDWRGRVVASAHDALFANDDGTFDRSNAYVFDCLQGGFDKWDIFENLGSCPFVVRCGADGRQVAQALQSGRLNETLKLYAGIAIVELPDALDAQTNGAARALAARYGAVVQTV